MSGHAAVVVAAPLRYHHAPGSSIPYLSTPPALAPYWYTPLRAGRTSTRVRSRGRVFRRQSCPTCRGAPRLSPPPSRPGPRPAILGTECARKLCRTWHRKGAGHRQVWESGVWECGCGCGEDLAAVDGDDAHLGEALDACGRQLACFAQRVAHPVPQPPVLPRPRPHHTQSQGEGGGERERQRERETA
eukprot:2489883-Rhodomonas_salina.1